MPGDIAEALALARGRLGPFGSPLLFFSAVGSTNDIAARLAAAGAAEGATVVAEMQTAGRGRLGHTWFSPPGAGLYVSVLVRPDGWADPRAGVDSAAAAPPLPALLTLLAGVALCEAVREVTGLPVEIKWPNDLVCGRRKLAGILAEASAQGAGIDSVVIGFGINVRHVSYPREIGARATSIEAELGRAIDRGLLLAHALQGLAACRAALREGHVASLLERWQRLAPACRGASVEWRGAGRARRGVTAGLAADGALLVDVDGGPERVLSGEIVWLD